MSPAGKSVTILLALARISKMSDDRIYRFDPHGNEYDKKGKVIPRLTYYQDGYEFCNLAKSGEHRSPYTHPYNFDDYWVWHDPKVDGELWGALHSDRLVQQEGYSDRYREIVKTIRDERERPVYLKFTKEETIRIVDHVCEGRVTAKGLAIGCNQSNGNPIIIFYYLENKK